MPDADPSLRELERHVAQLCEHFDSVRIIATQHQGGSSWMSSSGNGNWYAQMGSVREWIASRDEELRISQHRQDDA